MITTIKKWGNSQGIRIPKSLLDKVQWSENEKLELNICKNKIILEKSPKRKTIKELFADFNGTYTPINIDWGEPAGTEVL